MATQRPSAGFAGGPLNSGEPPEPVSSATMTIIEELILILLAIYAAECVALGHPKALVVTGVLGRAGGGRRSGIAVGSQGRSLYWLSPLPFAVTFISERLPISLGRDEVTLPALSDDCPPPQFEVVPIDQITSVKRDGRDLVIHRRDEMRLRLWTSTDAVAEQTRSLLAGLAEVKPTKRAAAADALIAERFDREAAARRLDAFRPGLIMLGLWASLLWLMVFIAAPLLARYTHLPTTAWTFIPALLIVNTFIAASFYRLHRRAWPGPRGAAVRKTLVMLVAPTTTMRAAHLLSRELLSGFDPVIVAAVAGRPSLLEQEAGRSLRESRHPFGGGEAPAGFDTTYAVALSAAIQHQGLDEGDLIQPTTGHGESCSAWCPRCLSTFTDPAAACRPCGGVAVRERLFHSPALGPEARHNE